MDPLKKTYRLYKNRISWINFQNTLNSFPVEKKWAFVRGSLLYGQSLKCKNCNPNIALLLLCSCADTLKLAGQNAGPKRNFKQLYLRYCPMNLRTPPIEYYPNKIPPRVIVPFDKALDYIYTKFRNLYTHEGIGRLGNLPTNDNIFWYGLLDVMGNDTYDVDMLKILEWFSEITMESLFAIL